MFLSSAYGQFLLEEDLIILLCAECYIDVCATGVSWLTHELPVVVVGDVLLVGGGVGVVGVPQMSLRLGFLPQRLMVPRAESRSLLSSLFWSIQPR